MLGLSNGSCPPAIGASRSCLPGRAPLTDLFISAFIYARCFNSLSVGEVFSREAWCPPAHSAPLKPSALKATEVDVVQA
ncbi:uncharacterized [Tachysurus ichikawai]